MAKGFKWSTVLDAATAVVAIVTLAATLVMVSGLPDTVPVHFGDGGVPDRWGSKFEMLALPVLGILFPALVIGINRARASGMRLHPWVREQKRAYAAVAALFTAVVCAGGMWFSFYLVLSNLREESPFGQDSLPLSVDGIIAVGLLALGVFLVIWGIQLRRGKWGRTIAGSWHASEGELQSTDRLASTRMFGVLMFFLAALVALAAIVVVAFP